MDVHDLLRVGSPLTAVEPVEGRELPPWAARSLGGAPWVVVRRAPRRADGAVPVGVRGASRDERLAAWVAPREVTAVLRPEELPEMVGTLPPERRAHPPAIKALSDAAAVFARAGMVWGPGGSVAFELASGAATVRRASDLDLVVRADRPVGVAEAAALLRALDGLPVRADALLETAHGGLALREWAGAPPGTPVLLRTPQGPRLTTEPWG